MRMGYKMKRKNDEKVLKHPISVGSVLFQICVMLENF